MNTSSSPIVVEQRMPGYWRVAFNNPPFKGFDPEMIAGLQALIQTPEDDREVKVVVFESILPDSFIAHIDFARFAEHDRRADRPVAVA